MDLQASQQHGGSGVTRDAQRQQGDHGAADSGVVGGLRGHHAVHDAGAVQFPVLGCILGDGVGDHTGHAAADAGQNTNTHANQGGNDGVLGLGQTFLQAEAGTFDLVVSLHSEILALPDALREGHDLGNGKQADQQHHQGKTVVQLIEAKGEAGLGVDRGQTHGGQQGAQHCADEALGHIMAGQGNDHGQREDGQRTILIGLEL